MRRLAMLMLVLFGLLAVTFAVPKPKTPKAQKPPTASSPQSPVSPNSPSLSVTVTPGNAQITAGAMQQFSALVTGSSNQSVLWSVTGPGCQAISCGSITGGGLYMAPSTPPSTPVITISARSFVDFTSTGTASVTIAAQSAPAITVSPNPSQLNPGGQQQFTASLTGNPGTQVWWSVSGAGCGFNCGTVSSTGLYTAPSTVPSPNTVTITAQAGNFPVYTGTAQVTILGGSNSGGSLTVSPGTVQLGAGGQQNFSASLNGVPTSLVAWSLSGVGCSGAACGTISSSGRYFAPASVSGPATVTITANSVPAGKVGTATVTLAPPVSVSVNPPAAHVSTNAQQQFTATVSNTPNTAVAWSISCASASCGSISAGGLYTAPAAVPFLGNVSVAATSLADLSQKGTATVTVTSASAATVSISPSSNLQLNTGAQQQFLATVTGLANTAVTWSLSGQGCSGAACGSITQTGLYTAPPSPPFFNSVSVIATSQASPAASASVAVQIIQVVGITLAPFTSPLTSGSQQQFAAIVTGTANTAASWSLSGSGCLVPGACGVISSSGLYTAPSGVTSPLSVTITATAQANPSKSVSAAISVVPPVVVTVSPGVVTASVNSQQQYTVTVTGTANTAVQWSVSGPGCSGATCGSIASSTASSVFYQAPASIPAPANVSVTATLVADNTKSGSASVNIVPTYNNKLNGHYAFQFSGFDGAVSYQAVGSFVADGNGNITNGIEDINCGPGASDVICGSAPIAAMTFSGSYTVNADNRGTFTINSSVSSATFSLALATVTGDVRFIETDSSGVRGSGVLKPQVRKDFVTPSTQIFGSAGYTLGMVGVDSSGGRIGMMGSIVMPPGLIQDGSLRINDRVLHCDPGTTCQDTTYLLPASGPNLLGTFTIDGTSGRGTLSIIAPGFGSGTLNLTMYVVSAGEYFLISSDPVATSPLLSGEGLQAQLPQAIAFFEPGSAVISWSAVNGGVPDAALGSISFSGLGGNATVSQLVFDENNGGVVTLYNLACPSCGFLPLGNNEMLFSSKAIGGGFHLYPFGLNSAFLLGNTPSVQFGRIETQTQNLAVNYAFASDSMIAPSTPLISGTASLSLPNVSGNEDMSQTTGFNNNLALKGIWPLSQSGGAGTISLTAPNQQSIAYWIVSYAKVLGLDVGTGAAPSLFVFEQ